MNKRVWITGMAMVLALGCESGSENGALQTPGDSGEPPLTRYCCDRDLADCVPEPVKACSEDDGRPVINWE